MDVKFCFRKLKNELKISCFAKCEFIHMVLISYQHYTGSWGERDGKNTVAHWGHHHHPVKEATLVLLELPLLS
jgi:hypothetical protein